MLDLEQQIAQLVDTAPPVTSEEVRARGRHRTARRQVLAATVVLVFAAGVAIAIGVANRASGPNRVDVSTPTSSASPNPGPTRLLGAITIPDLNLNAAVAEGVDRDTVSRGPGHVPTSALPGEAGPVIVTAHRTPYEHEFYDLDLLKPGNQITWIRDGATFTYEVTKSAVLPQNYYKELAAPDCCTALHTLYLLAANPKYSQQQTLVVEARQVSPPPG